MPLSVKDYAGRARDSRWERELAVELRKLPEPEKLAFVEDFAVVNPVVALDLAKKCLTDRRSYLSLLNRALYEADPSSIRYWLECVVPRLGFRKAIAHLRAQATFNPSGVERAKYWLPSFSHLDGYSKDAIESLRTLY